MEINKKPKLNPVSSKQKELLIEYIEGKIQMYTGKLTPSYSREKMRANWEELTNILILGILGRSILFYYYFICVLYNPSSKHKLYERFLKVLEGYHHKTVTKRYYRQIVEFVICETCQKIIKI